MKFNKYMFLVLAIQFLMISASFNGTNAELVADKSFEIFTGAGAYHNDVSDFDAAYNGTNTVDTDDVLDLNEDTDALFLPTNQDGFTTAEVDSIAAWFESGNKLLWVAGDSDFGGYFVSNKVNPVLDKVGSALRLDAGATADPVASDSASYRVRSVGHGDGPISNAVFDGVDNDTMPFHGPTSVYAVDADGKGVDLRNTDVDNVEVVITASKDAIPLDQDVSLGDDDYYFGIANDTAQGNYPLLAVETMGKSWVIVSGEAIFASYKFMYGDHFEKSGLPHVGKQTVDRLVSYYFDEVASGLLPVNNFAVLAALFVPAAIIYRRRK